MTIKMARNVPFPSSVGMAAALGTCMGVALAVLLPMAGVYFGAILCDENIFKQRIEQLNKEVLEEESKDENKGKIISDEEVLKVHDDFIKSNKKKRKSIFENNLKKMFGEHIVNEKYINLELLGMVSNESKYTKKEVKSNVDDAWGIFLAILGRTICMMVWEVQIAR